MTDQLSTTFLDALNEAQRARHDQPQLADQLQEVIQGAEAAWPAISVAAEHYLQYLAEVLSRPENDQMEVQSLHTADLYLALACSRGDAQALALCDASYKEEIDLALRRMDIQDTMIDEIKQTLRERLFVADPNSGRRHIVVYSGRGRLGAWLRVVAVRHALMIFRGEKRVRLVEEQELAQLAESHNMADAGLEQEHMKLLYRQEFKAAFRQAVDTLSEKESALLRQYFIQQLTIDQLGEHYGVHRSTAARWVDKAKRALISAIRRTMMQQMHVNKDTYESVIKLVSSQIDVSVRYLLGG